MHSSDVQRIIESLHDPALMDPRGTLLDRTGLEADDVETIKQVLDALREWKAEEARQSRASSEYMALPERDMRALRFIIGGERAGIVVTPAMVGEYLGITSAAITKMVDRLHARGHLVRAPHPTDRRAIALRATPHTRESARSQVGVQHARRFAAVARLTAGERSIVTRFLTDLATAPPAAAGGAASAGGAGADPHTADAATEGTSP